MPIIHYTALAHSCRLVSVVAKSYFNRYFIRNHLANQHHFGIPICSHRRIQKRHLEVAKRPWIGPKGPNFKKVPQFLKNPRISLPCCLPSNIDQTFLNKISVVFLLCPEICRFCAILGRFGGAMAPCPFPLWIRLCIFSYTQFHQFTF